MWYNRWKSYLFSVKCVKGPIVSTPDSRNSGRPIIGSLQRMSSCYTTFRTHTGYTLFLLPSFSRLLFKVEHISKKCKTKLKI